MFGAVISIVLIQLCRFRRSNGRYEVAAGDARRWRGQGTVFIGRARRISEVSRLDLSSSPAKYTFQLIFKNRENSTTFRVFFCICPFAGCHSWGRTVNYAADDISGFNAIVSKNGLSIHNLAQPILVASARHTSPFFQRSPLANSVFLAPQVTYANLLQAQQQQQQQQTPAATIEYVGSNNQFLPYSSISYGFNANGQLWWTCYSWTLHVISLPAHFHANAHIHACTHTHTHTHPCPHSNAIHFQFICIRLTMWKNNSTHWILCTDQR